MPATPAERRLHAAANAHLSWANTENRSERTAPARRALEAKWLEEAGGDPARAESLRRAHYARMALRSARARRKAREAREELAAVEAEAGEDLAAVEAELEAAGGGS